MKTEVYIFTVMRAAEPEPVRLVLDAYRTHAGDAEWLRDQLSRSPDVASVEVWSGGRDSVPVLGDPTPEYQTKTGRILTDADIQALADEAERGYDIEAHPPRPRKDEPPEERRT